jgi:hypothetical protein
VSLLGFDAIGRWALGQDPAAGRDAWAAIAGAQTAGMVSFAGGSKPSWTASVGTIGPFADAVRDDQISGRPIGWWDHGTPITLTNGNTFTVATDLINGILTIT